MKKILFAASEAVPFIKTGGLADVVGSLPKCFDKRYFDVRVIIPKYLCIKQEWRDKMQYVDHFYMDYLGQSRYVGILQYVHEGVTFYLLTMKAILTDQSHMGTVLGSGEILFLLPCSSFRITCDRLPAGCSTLS